MLVVSTAFPIVEAIRPRPIHETDAFALAVRLFDMEKSATEAVAHFRSFVANDPGSALPKFYLGFALNASQKPDDPKQFDEADQYLREAIAAQGAQKAAMTWVKDHRKFETYLVDFADSRMQRADELAERYDNGVSDADEARDRELRQPTYQLAMHALQLAELLNGGSLRTKRLLAKTEKYFDHFADAYERISHVIRRVLSG